MKTTREVLFEKSSNVMINPKNWCNGAWYFDITYVNRVFKVRNSTKREFNEMIKNINYNNTYKSRCSEKGFYVVMDKNCNSQFIGRCDSIIIKK